MYAAYVWVTTPEGERKRKYVYGKTRDEVHGKWLKLHAESKSGAVVTKSQTVAEYWHYWLTEVVVEPDYAPHTINTYEGHSRLCIIPGLGSVRLDKLSIRHVRTWLNETRKTCQCCAQGKDASRPAGKQRCCAIGSCCEQKISERTVQDVLMVLRAGLSNAVREELIPKNVAALVRVSKPRKNRKVKPWSVDEARHFLEAARTAEDSLYAAYVLILVLGLRKGEVLGLTWELVDLEAGELFVGEQLQRVGRRLLRRETKTESSEAPLPLPSICVAALKLRKAQQDRDRQTQQDRGADARWTETGLVFTTRYGTPIEPRNFNRSFEYRIGKASMRRITVHGTRKTCGTLLAALDVHPRVAMQILRHSRISVTMEIYTEATSEATREALRKLGDSLGLDDGGGSGGDTPRHTILVPDGEWDAARAAAEVNGETLSDVIRAALRRYVARNAKAAARSGS
jgi:integrase